MVEGIDHGSMNSGLGVILSGGGARGAYEAGVLEYAFGDLARRVGRTPQLGVISGTSVGAVNGTYLASTADDTASAVSDLRRMWCELELADVLSFGFRQAAGLHRVILGGKRATGIFDASPLASMVGEGIRWRKLGRNLRAGKLRALVVSATHVPTGRPVVFVDRSPDTPVPQGFSANVQVRALRIGPAHVLASASIPLVFPPVRVGRELHCDGGLRLNTPMAPALHMGMNRLLVIGVSDPGHRRVPLQTGRYPGASFMLGKVLNAFLLDHLNSDLEELHRINSYLKDGVAAYGPEFVKRINQASKARGGMARRIVNDLVIRPSVDLGLIASEYLKSHRARFGAALGRSFLRMLDVGTHGDSDLASYLLFDGEYARELIDLGRKDAAARRDELEAILFDHT